MFHLFIRWLYRWCNGSAAIAQRSAVMATTGNSFATSNRSWLLGVGANSTASGSRSGIMNSLESMTNPSNYVQTIVNSRGVKSLVTIISKWAITQTAHQKNQLQRLIW